MNTRYMNPYLAGFFLGIVLLATIFITGRGLGASGAIKDAVVAIVDGVAPNHAESSPFFGTYAGPGKENPLKSWLIFEIVGVIIGGFISGLISDRLKIVTEAGPKVKPKVRWTFADDRRRIVWHRGTVRTRLHEWCGAEWNGSPFDCGIRNNDGNFRNRICRGIPRAKIVDTKGLKVKTWDHLYLI